MTRRIFIRYYIFEKYDRFNVMYHLFILRCYFLLQIKVMRFKRYNTYTSRLINLEFEKISCQKFTFAKEKVISLGLYIIVYYDVHFLNCKDR